MRTVTPGRVSCLWLTFFACVVLYFTALFNGFVYDDMAQVLQNPWIRDTSHLGEIFGSEVWGFQGSGISNYYRPLLHVLYLVPYQLFGPNPLPFHALNILFHAGASVLVFLLALRLVPGEGGERRLAALGGALLFAAHPIHTEAVTPVMSVTDVALAFFWLLSLNLHLAQREKDGENYLLPAFFFFLAALCKEPALTLPLVLVAYDLLFPRGKGGAAVWGKRYLPYLAAVVGYFALRVHAIGKFVPIDSHPDLTSLQCLLNVFPLVAQYLGKLLVPVQLNAKYEFFPAHSLFEVKVLLSLLVGAGVVSALLFGAAKARTACFCLLMVLVPLLPTLYIRAIPYPFAERYLYLPSVGFVLLVALALSRWGGHYPRVLAGAVGVVLVWYGVGTVLRNGVWKDNYTLWCDTVQKSPGDAVARNNLATELKARGQVAEAVEQYRVAAALKPDPEIYRSLGAALDAAGRPAEAIEPLTRSLALKPGNAATHGNLGAVYGELGRNDKALEHFSQAVRLAPDDADQHYNLAQALRDGGQLERAVEELRYAAALKPGDAGIREALEQTAALAANSRRRR